MLKDWRKVRRKEGRKEGEKNENLGAKGRDGGE